MTCLYNTAKYMYNYVMKRAQYIKKRKVRTISLVSATAVFILTILYLFCVIPHKHDHHGHLNDRPGVRIHGKIEDFSLYESGGGTMFIKVDYWELERDSSLIEAEGSERVRVPIQSKTIIKNRFGWRVDLSHIAEDISVVACVPDMVYHDEEKRVVDCYEIWIQ